MLWSPKTKHHAKAIHKPEILMFNSNSCGPHFMDSDLTIGEDVVDSDLESVEICIDDSDQEVDGKRLRNLRAL